MARKPNPISKKEIDDIKNLIIKTGDAVVENAADCKKLANRISEVTGKYISESTIKRFLGFQQSEFSPSYDTIRILKDYILKSNHHPSNASDELEHLVLSFYNPAHFENIDKGDKSFQAACRSMALLLRKNQELFEKVMEPLAKSTMGRSFYYELFPDYEILSAFQYKGYEKYVENETTYEGKLFANCILFLKYFFDGNLPLMKSKWQHVIKTFEKSIPIHPFVLGRYYQTLLIASYYFQKKETKNIINEIFIVEKTMPRNQKGLFKEFPGFHYFVCDGLWYIDAHESLLQLSSVALSDFKKTTEFKWKGYYDQLYIYNSLALIKLGKIKEAKKNLKQINPAQFYFISKSYFEKLYAALKASLV